MMENYLLALKFRHLLMIFIGVFFSVLGHRSFSRYK